MIQIKSIRILSPQLDILGEVDSFASLQFSRKWSKPGEFTLVLNFNLPGVDELLENNLIYINKRAGIIKHREIQLSEDGDEIITVKGYELDKIFSQRLIIPPFPQNQTTFHGDVETILKSIIQHNQDNPSMGFDFLQIAPNQNRGETFTFRTGYSKMNEILERVTQTTSYAGKFELDFSAKKWIYEVLIPSDRTTNQTVLPPVIFSTEFDNIESQKFIESTSGYANAAVVVEWDDNIPTAHTTTGSTNTGLSLYVDYVSASAPDEGETQIPLAEQGQQHLSQTQKVFSTEAKALEYSGLEFEKDYFLGDLVSVRNKKWGITQHTQITEVIETYESNGRVIEIVFGKALPTLSERIQQRRQ